MSGSGKAVLAGGEDREERNESPGSVFFSAKSGDAGVPSKRRDGELGVGHDSGHLGSGGKDGEQKLSHKEVTGLLKSALQAASNVNEVGKMENGSKGAA